MQQISILLADSNSGYLEMCKDILERHGEAGRVDLVTSGKNLLEKINRELFDILLLSYEIDNKSGLEILRQIQSNHSELPVVIMIEEEHENIATSAMQDGASDYIVKVKGHLTALPFTIRKVIERKRINATTAPPESKPSASFDITDSHSPVYILDKRGRFISANQRFEHFVGYKEAELLELAMVDLLAKSDEVDYYKWFQHQNSDGSTNPFRCELIEKSGEKLAVELSLSRLRADDDTIIGYLGKVKEIGQRKQREFSENGRIDQIAMVQEVSETINTSENEPIQFLLQRIAEIASHIFKFRKITLALLDRRKHVYVKQAMIGFSSGRVAKDRTKLVPEDVISRIFSDNQKIRVMYSNRKGIFNYDENGFKEHLLFDPDEGDHETGGFRWHSDDIVFVNLIDKTERTFGYLSLSAPIYDDLAMHDLFTNLEIFGKLTSLAIESQYRLHQLDKRNRRLKQILVTSNIFKLHLNLSDLLKEVAWSVKLLLDFNLVGLALVSSRSGMLEMRAVACDDKIKAIQLQDLHFPIQAFSKLLKSRFKRSKSYLINEDSVILSNFKNIYYNSRSRFSENGFWKKNMTLLIPIPSRDQKISGVIIVDDPTDSKVPSLETVRTLELLANQVGVAIDNRILYIEMKNRIKALEQAINRTKSGDSSGARDFRSILDKYFE
ncbi:response regulator [candidate division KSB1 bacterium]|nr:response regulator [candidate division KSB1 bacterium]